ncbi:protein translocase subunit SecD [Tessaracoccus caeni]|uniref:protein translocase subunit SecD n=1 Tax=Tessaracoccus caeni TaxID=3031239 RepID=UPI0023D9A9D2|nr:protein translocase subunit SecD [Tessaracoccus caeni]MDF1489398.1 protein translocase subunit SecD [Tessaracoccus caeni]
MATRARTSRPGRTLAVFLGVIALLYVIMASTSTWTPKLGLDLRGGMTITLTATNDVVPAESLSLARGIIQQRVDSLGVGEASVTTAGDRNIVVSAPNISRDDLVELVGATAQLSFRPVITATAADGVVDPEAEPSDEPTVPGLPKPEPTESEDDADATPSGEDQMLPVADVVAYQPTEADLETLENFSCGDEVVERLDAPTVACDEENAQKFLLGPVAIQGQSVTTATSGIQQGDLTYSVSLQVDSTGATALDELTSWASQDYPNRTFAIVLDGVVRSYASAQARIPTGEASISGGFTADSAASLANILKFGALPLDFETSQVESVSPTLGGEQLRVGVIAGLLGLGAVAVYSFAYYRGLGIVVVGSLAVAASATYGVMVLLGEAVGFALNLPGVAGAIVGIAVTADSFIIYFERIRDEIRDGRSLTSSLSSGWKKARGTIVISDAVSLLSAVVLFFLAFGGVRGFAFTLGLTTVIDLAVCFFFTVPLMHLLGKTKFFGEGHKLSGLDPEHMGVSRASLLGRRGRRRSAVAVQEA